MLLDYSGRGYIFGTLAILVCIHQIQSIKIDFNIFIILLFSVSYATILHGYSQGINISTVLIYLILPPSAYIMGRLVANKNSIDSLIVIIFFCALFFSAISLCSVYMEILKNGFLGLSRNIALIGMPEDIEYAATGITSRLIVNIALIGTLLVADHKPNERKFKVAFILLFCVAICCVMRLGSRTGLAIAAISIITAICYNWSKYRLTHKVFLLIIFSISSIIIYSVLAELEEYFIFTFFMDRVDHSDAGILTLGGRSQQWEYFWGTAWEYPLGAYSINKGHYAHNIWLDAARVAGIVPFFSLVIMTLGFIYNTYKVLINNRISKFFKTLVLLLSVSIVFQFSMEPVLEGVPMLFILFCLLWGMTKEVHTRFRKLPAEVGMSKVKFSVSLN